MAGLGGDAYGGERVDVQAAHFDVLDAAGRQRGHGTLASPRGAFGPDARVVFVFDLQHVGVELDPVPAALRANGLIRRPWRGDGVVHARENRFDVVVAQDRISVVEGKGVSVGVNI